MTKVQITLGISNFALKYSLFLFMRPRLECEAVSLLRVWAVSNNGTESSKHSTIFLFQSYLMLIFRVVVFDNDFHVALFIIAM